MNNRKFLLMMLVIPIAVIGCIFFSIHSIQKRLYEQEIQRLYNSKLKEFNEQLAASERSRLAADHRYDSLDLLYKAVVARGIRETDSLKKIPGKFKSLTSKQLEDKMIEEFNKQN